MFRLDVLDGPSTSKARKAFDKPAGNGKAGNQLVIWLRRGSANVRSGRNEARQDVHLLPSGPPHCFPNFNGDDNRRVEKEVKRSANVGFEGGGRGALPFDSLRRCQHGGSGLTDNRPPRGVCSCHRLFKVASTNQRKRFKCRSIL